MRAEFLIKHISLKPDEMKKILTAKFQQEDRSTIVDSSTFTGSHWKQRLLYATRTSNYRILCHQTQDEELQIVVEPIQGNLLSACESVWSGAKKALVDQKPSLASLEVIDSDSDKVFLTASVTRLRDEFLRKETLTPMIVGLLVVGYVGIGLMTFAGTDQGKFIAGAVSGVASTVMAGIFAMVNGLKGALNWKRVAS